MLRHCSHDNTVTIIACTLQPGLVSIPFYAIPIFPLKFQFLNLLVSSPFFAAFSKSVDNNTMKATLAHSYMYQ